MAEVPNQTYRVILQNWKIYAIKQIKICAEYRDMRDGWICQVHLGFSLLASAQVPDKPALAWVACPGILHRS